MIYKPYGKTGLDISAISFGGMRFKDQQNVEDCVELVHNVYDNDINLFDTAPGYGKSEDLFGAAFKDMLKTRKERPFYVATKSMQDNPSDLRRELETSLTTMGLDYVDIFYMWCIMNLDAFEVRRKNGVLDEMEKMKSEGLIRNISVSTHMTGPDIEKMLNAYPFAGVLLGYSAMNFAYRDQGIEAATKNNMGVICMNPLGGGIIPNNPDRFSFVKTRDNETAVEAALRFLINDERITSSLVGCSTAEHVREAVSAVDGFQSIAPEQVDTIRDGITGCFNELCTGCGYCDICPLDIPIPKLMDVWNQTTLDGADKAMDRMRWHWSIDLDDKVIHACEQCGQCEAVCTQKLPIMERLKDIAKLADAEKAKE